MFLAPQELDSAFPAPMHNPRIKDLPEVIVRDLNNYGLCVLDDFLGADRAGDVLSEVWQLEAQGQFTEGRIANPRSGQAQDSVPEIRGDKIAWISGREPGCSNIAYLISQVDHVVIQANQMERNGLLGQYSIRGRSKAMVACYPGEGTGYVKHVDNPNSDGRCITATYYLNRDWDTEQDGGQLRVYPKEMPVVDIAPQFDRILFFWSDRRNPHSVQPAHRTRYAITMWYHDAMERERALRRQRLKKRGSLSDP